ncbi:MAG: response regulator transcription factor, partial [Sulfuricella sp.]|nr:response regulator transcription factor [Sulfuricella sp.]
VIVAECGDGSSALAEIERLRPDAAFLDIRMPGLSGLEVAARLAKTLQRLRAAVPAFDATARLAREPLAQLNARPAVETLRWLRAGAGEWLIRTALKELESRLDPQAFWRIHRGVMVRVAAIAQVRHDLMGKLWVEFHSGGKVQPVSRAYAHLFRQM